MEEYFNEHLSEFDTFTYKDYVEKYPEQTLLQDKYNISQAKILMRQTTYTHDECLELLNTKTIEECIHDYLGIVSKKEKERTTNQNILRAIRENF